MVSYTTDPVIAYYGTTAGPMRRAENAAGGPNHRPLTRPSTSARSIIVASRIVCGSVWRRLSPATRWEPKFSLKNTGGDRLKYGSHPRWNLPPLGGMLFENMGPF